MTESEFLERWAKCFGATVDDLKAQGWHAEACTCKTPGCDGWKLVSRFFDKDRAEQAEQLRVQLAGCGTAAIGGTEDPAKQGDYGWSPAYQDVLELRRKYDELEGRKEK